MPRPGPGFEKRVKEPVVTSLEGNVLGSVAVIGAGVSGLAAAYRLKKEGLKVTVFEADSSVGGKIKSSSKDGYVWESGANTMAESEPIVGQLISELQLEDLRLLPNQQNKRYIVRHGKAELVPSNPIAFLGSKLLSTPAKLRILAEPFMWKRRPSKKGGAGAASPETEEEEDESLADFLERHVGRESYPLRLPPVTYQPMTLVINAFKAADVLQPLPGFGVLVPAAEQAKGLKTLGTLFSSAMFWDRAPPGQVLFTTFVGGSRSRSVVAKSPDELQRIALHDIHQLLGVEGPPTFTKQVSWKQAFPEYGKGYGKVLDAIERLERDLPGLYYAGNHRGGLSVGTALASGYDTAGRIIADLQARGGSSLPAVVQLP
eukprot:jgi/Mesen1/4945/ME000247S04227